MVPLPAGEGRGPSPAGWGRVRPGLRGASRNRASPSPASRVPLPPGWRGRLIAPITRKARRLRVDMTDAERALWRAPRSRQVGAKFRRQHPVGNFVLDFACLDLRLGVELDGGQHNTQAGLARDESRTRWLESGGWRLLRFWNHEVLGNRDGVLQVIADTVAGLPIHPDGLPLSPRERGPGGEA
ncbi:MAG: endonuclease domain-containing protein [Rhodospirillales bacterium]|nr:endonuclease domain-containing protein [Rhodospirillales bacterium]